MADTIHLRTTDHEALTTNIAMSAKCYMFKALQLIQVVPLYDTDTDRGIAYNTTNIPTIVKLRKHINGHFYFERTIMNYELSVGDYIEISHNIVALKNYKKVERKRPVPRCNMGYLYKP